MVTHESRCLCVSVVVTVQVEFQRVVVGLVGGARESVGCPWRMLDNGGQAVGGSLRFRHVHFPA